MIELGLKRLVPGIHAGRSLAWSGIQKHAFEALLG